MNIFLFENATKVYFGKGGVKEYLCCLAKSYGDTVMLSYGSGSIKKNGIYDEASPLRLKAILKHTPSKLYALFQHGFHICNPKRITSVGFPHLPGGLAPVVCFRFTVHPGKIIDV